MGKALLERLTGVEVICLVHEKSIPGSNVVSLRGDISRPCLGLSPAKFDDVARRIDYVVHSAAMTNFGQPDHTIVQINVEGTRHVLELAARAGAPICHISTAFAYSDAHVSSDYPSHAYERSKLEAERVVRESGLPGVIVRPSIVIGDSIDGSMSSFQGFHSLMDLIVRGTFPVPGAVNALVDCVPRDLVADIIVSLIDRPDVTGEYWLTAGDRALPLERMVTLWVEHLRRLTGRAIKQPRMVEPDIVERLFRPALLPALPPDLQITMGRALQMLKYVNITRPFPSSLAELTGLLGSAPLPDPELTVIRNVEFWVRRSTSSPAAAPVLRRTGDQRA